MFITLLFVCSLSAVSAADQTIDNSTGISTGITNTGNGDTLTLEEGNYSKSTDRGITINKNITIQGNTSTNKVIIDAQGLNRIFTIGNNVNVVFINLTFINGYTTSNGGAILNNFAGTRMSVINCTFINNTANNGGAIYNPGMNSNVIYSIFTDNKGGAIYNSGGNFSVSNSIFTDNAGSSIFNSGVNSSINGSIFTDNVGRPIFNNAGNFSVDNSTFTNNIVRSDGGAIYNSGGTNFCVSNSTFINNSAIGPGGAIYNSGGTNFCVSNSTFINNSAIGPGGAIYISAGGANFSVIDSIFTDNSAIGHGGAIYNIANYGNLSVSNSTFTNNGANSNGGAIYIAAGSNFSVGNSTFINNTANSGGGAICNYGAKSSVVNSTFINNTANTGGVIFIAAGSNFSVGNSTFINNTATLSGGAIYNQNGGSNFSVIDSTFTGNCATLNGGAIYNTANNFSCNNSTFSDNAASNYGGAIYNTAVGSNFSVGNSTFINNTANSGGAIYNTANNFSCNNSTFSDNAASNYGGAVCNGGGMSVVGNVMSGNTAGISGPMIYNNGRMGILNLTYLSNMTVIADTGSVMLYATLTDDMGNTVSGGTVYFYVNGTLVGSAISDSNGMARVSFTIPTSMRPLFGQPNNIVLVNGTYSGHTGYSIDMYSGELEIPYNDKIPTKTTINVPSNIKSGQNITISGVATDAYGNPLANIVIYITNGHNFTVTTNSTGGWSYTFIYNNAGNYNIFVSWDGNSTHFDFINSTNIVVNQLLANSTINIPSNTRIGQNINITGIATDENGNPLLNTTLIVTIGGNEYIVVTNSTGGWNILYTPDTTGNVIIRVNLEDSINYEDFSNSTTFNVGKIITNSTIIVPSGKVGQQSTISGVAVDENGNVLANVEITVVINGTSYSVNTTNTGAWSLNYTPGVSGNLGVVVSWIGNNTHAGFSNNTVFNVANASTNSTIVVVNSTVGKSTTINGTAIDENGNVLANVQLNVTVNGVDYSVVTNGAGFWSLTYIPNIAGSLNVQVTWAGNATHNGFTNSTLLNVSRAATNSTINVNGSIVGKNIIISGTAVDENGNPLANVTLNVTINGIVHSVTTNNAGFWSLTYVANSSGTFNVQVSYLGNSTHFDFLNTTSFNIANASTNSTINTPNGKVGQQSTITGVATDENGNPLANVQINVIINGTSYSVNTSSTGAWSLNYTPSVSGNLDVVVSWAGNGTHNGFTNATVFTVVNAGSNSTIVVPSGNAGQSMNITGVALDDNGNPLAGVQLTVVIDGSSYNVTTDGVGAWSIIFTPGREGLFDLSVSWAGNSTHNGFTNDTVFSVPKIPTNSTINAPNTKVGEQSTISGVALDDNGNPLANIQLTVVVDGTVYNVTTDSTGVWSLNITPINSGSLNVVVSWIGNNTHHGFSNLTVFVVAKLATNSSVIVSNATVGKSTIIRGVLADENNKPIIGANLTVIVDGKSFNVINGADGSWNLSYTLLKAGKLTIKVDYIGNSNYLASTNSTVLTVSEGPVNPVKPDIRFIKRTNKKSIKNGKKVIMKYLTYKNFGGSGSQNLSAQVLFKNFKYKVLNKIKLQYAKNKVKFKVTLKSGGTFTLKIKTYRPIKAKT